MIKKLTYIDTLQPFLTAPKKEYHLAHIARELQQPHPTTRLHLQQLVKEGVLNTEERGGITLFSLNFYSSTLVDYLVIAEKRKLIQKCENDPLLERFVAEVHMKMKHGAAILFGSATISTKNAHDFDLLVVGNIKETDRFSRIFKPLHLIDTKYKHITKALRLEIVKKHLIIEGGEEVVKWLLSS